MPELLEHNPSAATRPLKAPQSYTNSRQCSLGTVIGEPTCESATLYCETNKPAVLNVICQASATAHLDYINSPTKR